MTAFRSQYNRPSFSSASDTFWRRPLAVLVNKRGKVTVTVIAAGGIVLLSQTIASADTVPLAIRARYAAAMKAVNRKDIAGFSESYAPQYIAVSRSGKVSTRARFLTDIGQTIKASKEFIMTKTLNGATTHAGTVDVSFVEDVNLQTARGVMTVHEVGVDSWKNIGGKWFTVKTVDTVFQMTSPR